MQVLRVGTNAFDKTKGYQKNIAAKSLFAYYAGSKEN